MSALRQLTLLADVPVLVAWGTADRTIPPSHHRDVATRLPNAQTVELAGVGHYPQESAPQRLLPPVLSFLSNTYPAAYRESRWRDLLTGPYPVDGPDSVDGLDPVDVGPVLGDRQPLTKAAR